MSTYFWYPTRKLADVADEMNRLVRQVAQKTSRETSLKEGECTPPVDIAEDENNFYLYVELPGQSREDIRINYDAGTLTIKGRKKAPKKENGLNFHRVERRFGEFERSFHLPEQLQVDKIRAEYHQGLLTVILPKAEEAKPKHIDVKIQ